MKRVKQQSECKLIGEKIASLPLPIVPPLQIDRLAGVKSWLRKKQRRPPSRSSRFQRLRFINNVAAIIAVTYAECGDGAVIPDDVALMRIRDLLLELDTEIIERVKNKEKKFSYHSKNSLTVSIR